MKLKVFQKRRKVCDRVQSIMSWIMLLAFLNLTGIVGCIEQSHISLKAGAIEALWTILVMVIALAVHQWMEHIACYREIGRYIEAKK